MKVNKVQRLGPGIYAHVCPLCGQVLDSSCEMEMLPEFSICSCDRNGNRSEVYEVFERDGVHLIRRNKPPRFVGKLVFGERTDIELVDAIDDVSASDLAAALRKAGEFLIKRSREVNHG